MSARLLRIGLFFAGFVLSASTVASAVTRDEVMVRARAFAHHPWRMTTSNVRGTCGSGYTSVYTPGDYMGLPYDWGGYMTIGTFDQGIKDGKGAGSYPADGIISCAVGLDCSGFVSQTWGAGHTTTSGMHTITTAVSSPTQLLPGDVMNEAGYHVSLYSHRLTNGEPLWIESIDYGVHVNPTGGWSWVEGWAPLKYRNITGTTAAANPVGTNVNPIVIGALPYTDTRSTADSVVAFFDTCGADRSKNESGSEYVYKLVVTQPGTLTAAVTDGSGVDIDVHVYSSLNTNDCVARNDRTVTMAVDCGTYYVVADTFVSSGVAQVGQYTLNVSLAASGAACGSSGPRPWNFAGEPGDRCSFPGDDSLPTCNANLGSETCLYTTGAGATSWCTHSCVTNADCAEFSGGCCDEIGNGEKYCMVRSFCGAVSTPDAGTPNTNTRDAGFPGDPEPDAGPAPVVDAGPPPVVDAGPPPGVDAGPPPPVDAGSSSVADAGGTVSPDPEDAGSVAVEPDAGGPDDGPETPTGCGCGAIDPGFLMLSMLVLRRRRVSER